jgi:hypothetical protein
MPPPPPPLSKVQRPRTALEAALHGEHGLVEHLFSQRIAGQAAVEKEPGQAGEHNEVAHSAEGNDLKKRAEPLQGFCSGASCPAAPH